MLEGLLGGLVDKEKATRETITNSFEDFAEELGVSHKEMFITIVPMNEKFGFAVHLYKIEMVKVDFPVLWWNNPSAK